MSYPVLFLAFRLMWLWLRADGQYTAHAFHAWCTGEKKTKTHHDPKCVFARSETVVAFSAWFAPKFRWRVVFLKPFEFSPNELLDKWARK